MVSSIAEAGVAVAKDKPKWLISNWVDLLFICGLAPWILGLITFFLLGPYQSVSPSASQQALTMLYVIAALTIGEGHQFTSILRYFKRKQKFEFDQFMVFTVLGGIALLGMTPTPLIPFFSPFSGPLMAPVLFFAAVFPVVLMQHVCGQARSVGLIYCGKNDFKLSASEKKHLSILTWLLALAGAVNVAAPFTLMGPMDQSFIPAPLQACVNVSVAAVALAFAYRMIQRGLKKDEWLPPGAGWLWTNLTLWILLPLDLLAYVWLFVPIFFHATQHWGVAWITQQKESGGKIENFQQWACELLRLTLPVQVVSLTVLFLPVLLLGTKGPDGTLPVFWSMYVFYSHYIADRTVWRENAEVSSNKVDVNGEESLLVWMAGTWRAPQRTQGRA